MGTSRRVAGRRGSYRPVGSASVHGSHAERTTRRLLRSVNRAATPPENGQASVVTVPPALEDYYVSGRPMMGLFGCQDLRKFDRKNS